jgi:hypothetical protein
MRLGAGFVVQDLDISLSRCSVGKGMDVPQIFFHVWFLNIVALLDAGGECFFSEGVGVTDRRRTKNNSWLKESRLKSVGSREAPKWA